MRNYKLFISATLLCGALAFTACSDEDYDDDKGLDRKSVV